MKIFISWSGELSNKVALVLRDWLPSVIQAIEPYVSSEDIDKGARWSSDIAKELEASRFGILCVTRENAEAPWLNFEASALSKTIDKSRVCPFLVGLKRSEIRTGPLLQFQSTIYERDDLAKLLHSINNSAEPRCIDEARLDGVFDVWWPKLQESLDPLLSTAAELIPAAEKTSTQRPPGAQSEILEEILELARNQQKLLNSPEVLLPPAYLERVMARTPILPDNYPAVLDDLYMGWRTFHEIASGLKNEEAIPREVVMDIMKQLEAPIQYLSRRRTTLRELPRRPKRPGEEP